jgi:uncharacterized protein with WD repeat
VRKAKKGGTVGANPKAAKAVEIVAPPVIVATPAVQTAEKKIKKIGKKLKAIQDIKDKMALGLEVELTQIKSVNNEAELLAELAKLNLELE